MDDHPRRHPDDEHLRPRQDGHRPRNRQAAVAGVVQKDGLHRAAGQDAALPGCPTCFPQSEGYSYGLGIVETGNWLLQDPLFSGEAGVFAYLPSQKVAISLALTFSEEAFGPDGNYTDATGSNAADQVWREIAVVVAPNDPPPMQKK